MGERGDWVGVRSERGDGGMITPNWHNPQPEARNPHPFVAIFRIWQKFSPELGQWLHKIAETLTGWALQSCSIRNYSTA